MAQEELLQGLEVEPQRILICLLGTSPGVVTETVWALLHQSTPWIPSEIHVVTSSVGWADASGETGSESLDASLKKMAASPAVARLLGAKRLPAIEPHFDRATEDFQSERSLLWLAGELERIWPKDGIFEVHLSIAGGRKGEAKIAGDVMSHRGRLGQDQLSQVLLDPVWLESAEGVEHFRFPGHPAAVTYVDRHGNETCRSEGVTVRLVTIPFVPFALFGSSLLPLSLGEDSAPGELSQYELTLKYWELAQREDWCLGLNWHQGEETPEFQLTSRGVRIRIYVLDGRTKDRRAALREDGLSLSVSEFAHVLWRANENRLISIAGEHSQQATERALRRYALCEYMVSHSGGEWRSYLRKAGLYECQDMQRLQDWYLDRVWGDAPSVRYLCVRKNNTDSLSVDGRQLKMDISRWDNEVKKKFARLGELGSGLWQALTKDGRAHTSKTNAAVDICKPFEQEFQIRLGRLSS